MKLTGTSYASCKYRLNIVDPCLFRLLTRSLSLSRFLLIYTRISIWKRTALKYGLEKVKLEK